MKNNTSLTSRGYTLIEVIVALAVFAILATLSGTVLVQAFNTRTHLAEETSRLNNLQLATTLIRRDAAQMVERAIRGTEGHLFPPFVGESNYLEFTRSGVVNPNAVVLSSALKRVALLCSKKQLIRRSWISLDGPTHSDYQDKVLLDNLQACSIAYLSRSRQILNEWRPYAVQQNQKKEPLPTAIQLTLGLEHLGNLSLLFIIPESLYGA